MVCGLYNIGTEIDDDYRLDRGEEHACFANCTAFYEERNIRL